MTTLVESLAQVGVTKRDDEDIVFVTMADGRAFHYTPRQANHRSHVEPDTYIATGRFERGSVGEYSGRTVENLRSIWTLPFDCDLKDYLDATPAEIHALSDAELDDLLDSLRSVAIETFRALGLAPSRIVRTGYGLALFLDIDEERQHAVETLRSLHKRLVARVNATAGFDLADKQVSDAGTRIMRLPGSANTKGPQPRIAETIHEGGPTYTPEQLEAVAGIVEVPREALRPAPSFSCENSATADDVARLIAPYWRDGSRHGMALAVAGMLAKAGVDESSILSVLLPNAHRQDVGGRDMQKVAKTTVARARAGAQVAGYQALAGYVPGGVLDDVDKAVRELWKANNPLPQSSAPQITFSGALTPVAPEPEQRYRVEFDPLPDAALYGAAGEYVRLALPATESPPQFHLGCFYTMIGALTGRTVYTRLSTWKVYPNVYAMLIGTTGNTRKDTAIAIMEHAIDAAQLAIKQRNPMIIAPTYPARIFDVASEPALIEELEQTPSLLLILKELDTLFKKMKREGTSTLVSKLLEAWDSPSVIENRSMANKKIATNPFLSIIGGIQPDVLRKHMSNSETSSGFANRWLPLPGGSIGPNHFPPLVDDVRLGALMSRIALRIDDIRTIGGGVPIEIALSDDALDAWIPYYDDHWHRTHDDPDLGEVIQRYPTYILKFAMIYALAEDSRDTRPRIERQHVEAAIQTVQWAERQILKVLPEWGASDEVRIEGRIMSSLTKHGALPRRVLYQNTYIKGTAASLWNKALRSLLDNQTVVEARDEAGKTFVMLADQLQATA